MTRAEFEDAIRTIRQQSFSSTKMSLAKQVTRNHCLLSDQVERMVRAFSFSSDQMEFAKFAYDHAYDLGNLYKVSDAFDFSSDRREWMSFLNARQ